MKATLEFQLPEDQAEFALASSAGALASALRNLDLEARNALKHGHEFEEPEDVLRWVREQIGPEVRDLLDS